MAVIDIDHDHHHNIHDCYHEEIDLTRLTTKEKEVSLFYSIVGKTDGKNNHYIQVQRK